MELCLRDFQQLTSAVQVLELGTHQHDRCVSVKDIGYRVSVGESRIIGSFCRRRLTLIPTLASIPMGAVSPRTRGETNRAVRDIFLYPLTKPVVYLLIYEYVGL